MSGRMLPHCPRIESWWRCFNASGSILSPGLGAASALPSGWGKALASSGAGANWAPTALQYVDAATEATAQAVRTTAAIDLNWAMSRLLETASASALAVVEAVAVAVALAGTVPAEGSGASQS